MVEALMRFVEYLYQHAAFLAGLLLYPRAIFWAARTKVLGYFCIFTWQIAPHIL